LGDGTEAAGSQDGAEEAKATVARDAAGTERPVMLVTLLFWWL